MHVNEYQTVKKTLNQVPRDFDSLARLATMLTETNNCIKLKEARKRFTSIPPTHACSNQAGIIFIILTFRGILKNNSTKIHA